MSFEYNFPTIVFTEKMPVSEMSVIIPYKIEDGKAVVPKKWYDNLEDLIPSLPKEEGSVFETYHGKQHLILICPKAGKFEDAVASAVKMVPDNITTICVILGKKTVDDKALVSKTMLSLCTHWSMKTDNKPVDTKHVYFVVKDAKEHSSVHGKALAESQAFVQQLVNMPSNVLTPVHFGEIVEQYFKEHKLDKKIDLFQHGTTFIRDKEKMGSYWGVAKGSDNEPNLIVAHYKPKNSDNPLVFVGKGLTFDSGGISIKPSGGMADMKSDMAGAATAIGAIIYAAKTNSPVAVTSIAACCENMPSSKSLKPGDVLTASNGTTIEVIDTDAEGRLVLADALHFSKQFNAKYTIDMATLTGACVVALGKSHTGVFTECEELADLLLSAGKESKDAAWRLPLEATHDGALESSVADIANLAPGYGAGASTAAAFLRKFAPEKNWAHLDIAGSAWSKSATGRPMGLISTFIDSQTKE